MSSSELKQDLSYGIDVRGDFAYFIEAWHFNDDGWSVDKDAVCKEPVPTFFRVLKDGIQTSSHGWIDGHKVIQWG